MALNAFDVTWNKDKPGAEGDANVKKFCEAYQQKSFYTPGVGTRFGKAGAIADGVTGDGGRTRVKDMLDSFKAHAMLGVAPHT